jgi:hypothetical protein
LQRGLFPVFAVNFLLLLPSFALKLQLRLSVWWAACGLTTLPRDEPIFVLGFPSIHGSVAIATQWHAVLDLKYLLWELLHGFDMVGMNVSRVSAQNALSSKTAEDGLFPGYVFRSFAE